MGALAGSYDAARGTMRHLVMTGARREAIYASRAVALVLSVHLAVAPAVLLALVLALALPSVPDDALGARDVLALVWAIALFAAVYALVSMGIGALLHSNGAAVTIARRQRRARPGDRPRGRLERDRRLLRAPGRPRQLTGDETEIGVAAAALALAAWLSLFLAAGWLRVARERVLAAAGRKDRGLTAPAIFSQMY